MKYRDLEPCVGNKTIILAVGSLRKKSMISQAARSI